MSQPPDDSDPTPIIELISRAQRGEEEAFHQLWTHSLYDPDLHLNDYLAYLERDSEERKDLAQEIGIKVWLKLPDLRNPAKYRSWLFKIAFRTAIDSHRRRRPQNQPLSEAESDTFESPARADLWVEEKELTKRALAELQPTLRACLILAVLGFSADEIAEITGIDAKSAATYVSKARARVREIYKRLEQDQPPPSPSQDRQPPWPSKEKQSSHYYEERIQRRLDAKHGSFLTSRFKELFGKGVEFNGR